VKQKSFAAAILFLLVMSGAEIVQSKEGKFIGKIGEVKKIGNVEMVYIDGGTFTMGSPESEKERVIDEEQHEVTLSPFWIGKYEVTQKQYKEVMDTNPSFFKGDKLPVESVSLYDVVEFCNKLSEKNGLKPYYNIDKNREDPNKNNSDKIKWTVTIVGGNGFRLPTEAEWEYACRGGTTTVFHYGNKLDSTMANFNGNYPYNADKGVYREKTTDVGSFKPNAYGLYDMHGNTWEWCFDWYYEAYYSRSPVNNPKGSDRGDDRVLRGGSWFHYGSYLRSASRIHFFPSARCNDIGFRLVRSAQ